MKTVIRKVDNRTFLLGLDKLYRQRIRIHERGELLDCAIRVTKDLEVEPAQVAVEGYYHEEKELREYFLLMRALQRQPMSRMTEIQSEDAFKRLLSVTSSRIFGFAKSGENLLPSSKDPLSLALEVRFPEWNVEDLTNLAYKKALNSEDFSLVALAALAKDPVVLAALRESVVLYVEAIAVAEEEEIVEYKYEWRVDEKIEERADKFVDTFNTLFSENIPQPNESNAAIFYESADFMGIVGRCVRIGYDDSVEPIRHYHWAIKSDGMKIFVDEFWDEKVWTTETYYEFLQQS